MKRSPLNPIITRESIPRIEPHLIDVSSVFNPGAVKFHNTYVLLLRVQNRGRETFLMTARSVNGTLFEIDRKIVELAGIESVADTIYHVYDPRITMVEGSYYIMVAMDMDCGCVLGLARTDDFEAFEFLGIVSEPENRNGVLFPEKIGGRYVRFDRPNKSQLEDGLTSGDTICVSVSDDLLTWKREGPLMSGRWHYWDERIGAGPPPVKTREGWLLVYHGIATHFASSNIYQAGAVLVDLDDPTKVIARGRYNILEPRESYELTGQVPNVVFPSGMIVEQFDDDGFALPGSEVKIYYGAADTSVGLVHTTVNELIRACYAGGDVDR